jgi:K+-sensing histidine kinase KdpD
MVPIWRIAVKSFFAVVVCCGVAVLLCTLMNNGWEFRVAAPMICLQAVIVVSLFLGRVPGLVGAVAASLTFAVLLFPPVGRLAVAHPVDRVILLVFQLAGVGIVFLTPRTPIRWAPLGGRPYRILSRRGDKQRRKTSA